MSTEQDPSAEKPAGEAEEKKASEPTKSTGKEPYVSRFKKQGGGFNPAGPAGGGKGGYRGPPTRAGGAIRPRGGNRGS